MTDLPHAPPPRANLPAIARAAIESVPAGLSARRRLVRLTASLILPVSLAAPFLGAGVAVALVATLAVLVRLAALLHLLRRPRPDHPEPGILPEITILLPLHEEVPVVEGLVAAVRQLDYPAELVEVIALLEQDDPQTLAVLRSHAPPSWRIVVLPEGQPQTKARACNVGLALGRGEVFVIFDGEDRPEPDQARKAVAALAAVPRRAVVQARLGCDHARRPGTHLLARFWALEYAVLFGAIQPALAGAGLPFLLGGTSNWFVADALRQVGGWDAHNVTEDADLGVRLARAGWTSSVIDSTTWEEAPIHLGQWVRQRSRWLKGFAVTTAVHFLRPDRLLRDLGPAGTLAVVAQLPATLICAAAHPIGLWLVFAGGFGPFALVAAGGYGVAVALHVAVARREGVSPWLAPFVLLYWLLQTAAIVVAVVDLIRAPARWRKTPHGLVERPAANGADARSTVVETLHWPMDLPAPANSSSPRQPAAAWRET